jgi:hypothetical protein
MERAEDRVVLLIDGTWHDRGFAAPRRGRKTGLGPWFSNKLQRTFRLCRRTHAQRLGCPIALSWPNVGRKGLSPTTVAVPPHIKPWSCCRRHGQLLADARHACNGTQN